MDYLDYIVLKNRKEEFTDEEKEICFKLLRQLVKLCMLAKKDGLIAMEEHAYTNELDEEMPIGKCYKDAILHVVDGNQAKDVEQYLCSDVVFYGADTFQGYLCYLIMKGILTIQAGNSQFTFRDKMQHFFPFSIREEVMKQMDAAVEEQREKEKEKDEKICKPVKCNHPFMPQVIRRLNSLDDDELNHFVQKAAPDELRLLLANASDGVRIKMLKNIPESVREEAFETAFEDKESLSKILCSVMCELKKYHP